MNGISLILCCHNSAKRLPKTLKHIAAQRFTKSLPWEVIVINNNSTDSTKQTAQDIWIALESPAPLNVFDETKTGLSFAREKGIQVAKYNILLWCDDDNWLCDTYVETAYDVMNTNLGIGALGGWCEAVFELEKPEWFDAQAKYFAVSKQGRQSGDITNKKGCVYGAGMVVRKLHAKQLQALGFKQVLQGRTGKKLSSGEDTEYCYALRLLGYKIWYDERLYFQHFMASERLNLNYVSRIREAMVRSNFTLWAYLDLLNGRPRSHRDFINEASQDMPRLLLRKTGALLFGSFEQKEQAKRYFRSLKLRLFHYSEYRRNLESIKGWLPNAKL